MNKKHLDKLMHNKKAYRGLEQKRVGWDEYREIV